MEFFRNFLNLAYGGKSVNIREIIDQSNLNQYLLVQN